MIILILTLLHLIFSFFIYKIKDASKSIVPFTFLIIFSFIMLTVTICAASVGLCYIILPFLWLFTTVIQIHTFFVMLKNIELDERWEQLIKERNRLLKQIK